MYLYYMKQNFIKIFKGTNDLGITKQLFGNGNGSVILNFKK